MCLTLLGLPSALSQERVVVEIEWEAGDGQAALSAPLRRELQTNVLAFLSIHNETKSDGIVEKLKKAVSEEQETPRKRRPVDLQRLHKLAEEEIKQALQPFGFYNPIIAGELSDKRNSWIEARYRIIPGPRIKLRNVGVRLLGPGAEHPPLMRARQNLSLTSGDWLDHRRYATEKNKLLASLYDAGFLDVKYTTAQMSVDPARGVADVDWVLDSGQKYLFGPIEIDQSILHEDVVRRFVRIQPGDTFDFRRLIDLQISLKNTNYFDGVRVDVRRKLTVDQRVPVTLVTTPRKRLRYNAGVGFGTDTGPRLTAGIDNRRVNKLGHRLRLDTRLSSVSNAVQFEYHIPIKDVANDRWRFVATAKQEDVADADTDQFVVGLAREDGWLGLRRRLFFNVERENFAFDNEPSQASTLVYPGMTLSKSVLDNAEDVRRGYRISATVAAGHDDLGSDVNFTSASLAGRIIYPLAERFRLLGGFDVATVRSNAFDELPPSQRLFAGGDRSVRGYAYQSISPTSVFGDDIGGSHLVTGSIELETAVTGQWGVAAFFDAGMVDRDWSGELFRGAGLGLRYRSPVGVIRVDLAHPFDDPDSSFRLHISIGPDL